MLRHALFAGLLAMMAVGCSSPTQFSIANPTAAPAAETRQPGALQAGMAVADITPPPGMPKAGYSKNAHYGDSFRTRLKARVFYIAAQGSAPIVVVQTDLLAGSSPVRQQVLANVATATGIAPENLIVTATHTHAGPGQFLGTNFYNRFASNAEGFEPDYYAFLVRQLTAAVQQAHAQRRPARLATGRIDVWGLTRNRSLAAHLENPKRLVADEAAQNKFHAINPALYLIRVDAQAADGQYYPLGAISNFSIHGTGIPSTAEELNADVWAWIERDLEWRIKVDYHPPWQPAHAAFEGTHGDMAPAIRPGMPGFIEARRIGEGIAAEAYSLFRSLDGRLKDQAVLRSALREVDVFQQPSLDGATLCERAAVGTALTAGAHENTTPVLNHLPFFAPGWPRWFLTGDCQAEKRWVGFAWLQPLVLPREDFPHRLPVQVLQVDDLALVGLPFELTTMTGRLIAERVRAEWSKVGQPIQHIAVTSLANEYWGYAVTPDEYKRQHYEGGHTLYGPQTAPYIAAQAARLSRDLLAATGNVRDLPARWDYTLKTGHYLPQDHEPAGQRQPLSTPEYLDPESNREGYWAFRWQDVNPSRIHWQDPLVRVEYSDDGKVWQPLTLGLQKIDDEGYDVGVHFLDKAEAGMAQYEARWYNPQFHGERKYRFVIAPRGKEKVALVSPAFG